MKATILSFRRGRHTQTTNQFLLELPGVDTHALASQFIGRRVLWQSTAGKKIYGKITQTHGNSGIVRARFSKGLPGTAITNKIEIIEKETKKATKEKK
ncbi:MAG: 50S ribosomal protein L35ae [Nanoarchaeota archaeon]|nr:50S ribosomal protein L35ae [Nanoarchaeota archaeon]